MHALPTPKAVGFVSDGVYIHGICSVTGHMGSSMFCPCTLNTKGRVVSLFTSTADDDDDDDDDSYADPSP